MNTDPHPSYPPKPGSHALLSLAVETARLACTEDQAARMSLAALGLDSLELVTLAMAFEDTYNLYLDVDLLSAEMTLGELVNLLRPFEA